MASEEIHHLRKLSTIDTHDWLVEIAYFDWPAKPMYSVGSTFAGVCSREDISESPDESAVDGRVSNSGEFEGSLSRRPCLRRGGALGSGHTH